MRSSAARTANVVVALAVAGCAVGPDYEPHDVATPEKWSEPLGRATADAAMARWWTTFGDPALDSLIERAVAGNLDLRAAEARVLEARALEDAAFGGLLPELGAGASYTRQRVSKNAFPIPGAKLDRNVYQAGFDASWEIDVFGGNRRELEASGAEAEAAAHERDDVLVTLLAEVARTYVELRGAQRRLEIARDNIVTQSDALSVARSRFRAGLTSELDVKRAESLLASTEADVPVLERERQRAIHRLGLLTGGPPGALAAELAPPAPIPIVSPSVPVGLPSDLLRRRPDVRRAERELAAATARIGVAEAELFPKLSLLGLAGLESFSASDWWSGGSRFWTVGPSVSWRIFEGGRLRALVRASDARAQQALARYEQTVLVALEDVENALVALANEEARRCSLAESVEADGRAVELANELYTKGISDFINVLDAQRSLYRSQDELVRSQRAVAVELVALHKALGGGWDVGP